MPSITKNPTRLDKGSNTAHTALPTADSERKAPLKLRLQLALNALVVLVCLCVLAYTNDIAANELCKALAIMVCLNMFRIISNSNTLTEK